LLAESVTFNVAGYWPEEVKILLEVLAEPVA